MELSRLHLDLARQFEYLSFLANSQGEAREGFDNIISPIESLVERLRTVISEIRTKEGFENFLEISPRDTHFETLSNHATAVINTTKFRTDAILLRGDGKFQVLKLDKSIFEASQTYYRALCKRFNSLNLKGDWKRSNNNIQRFLEWLWESLVQPILHEYSFKPLDMLSQHLVSSSSNQAASAINRRDAGGPKYRGNDVSKAYKELIK